MEGDRWPLWPADEAAPMQLVDVVLRADIDALFDLMFGASTPFAVKAQELRNDKDVAEGPWLPSEEAALEGASWGALGGDGPVSASGGGSGSSLANGGRERPHKRGDMAGCARFTTCSSSGMGLKYRTDELQRCTEAREGRCYEVQSCVATTATYGDRFRSVIRHRLTREGPDTARWRAEAALVFISPTNVLVRKAIDKGAQSGLQRNFDTVAAALKTFVPEVVPEATAPAARPARAPSAAWASLEAALAWAILDERLVAALEPVAGWLVVKARLGDQAPPSGRHSRLAIALALGLWALALSCALCVLRAVHLAAAWAVGEGSAVAWLVGLVDLPDSVAEVALSLAVLLAVHAAAARMGARLGLLPPGACSTDTPRSGVRFLGFESALASASAGMVSSVEGEGAERLQPRPPPRTPSPAPAGLRRQQLREGLRSFGQLVQDTFKGRGTEDGGANGGEGHASDAAGEEAPAPVAEADSARAKSPPAARGRRAEGGGQSIMAPLLASLAPEGMMASLRLARPNAPRLPPPEATAADGPGEGGEREGGDVELSAMQRRALSASSIASSRTAPGEDDIGVVEEEVFENERLQPFRGWGHMWPGHFLPTDRVGHWSTRSGKPGGAESMDFHTVARTLPNGWDWVEEDWHIDMGGLEEAACDAEGWSYAIDFSWLTFPPTSGSGRFRKMLDFVRRRRWVRTRVRAEPGASGPRAGSAQHVAMADLSAARGGLRLSELLAQQSTELPDKEDAGAELRALEAVAEHVAGGLANGASPARTSAFPLGASPSSSDAGDAANCVPADFTALAPSPGPRTPGTRPHAAARRPPGPSERIAAGGRGGQDPMPTQLEAALPPDDSSGPGMDLSDALDEMWLGRPAGSPSRWAPPGDDMQGGRRGRRGRRGRGADHLPAEPLPGNSAEAPRHAPGALLLPEQGEAPPVAEAGERLASLGAAEGVQDSVVSAEVLAPRTPRGPAASALDDKAGLGEGEALPGAALAPIPEAPRPDPPHPLHVPGPDDEPPVAASTPPAALPSSSTTPAREPRPASPPAADGGAAQVAEAAAAALPAIEEANSLITPTSHAPLEAGELATQTSEVPTCVPPDLEGAGKDANVSHPGGAGSPRAAPQLSGVQPHAAPIADGSGAEHIVPIATAPALLQLTTELAAADLPQNATETVALGAKEQTGGAAAEAAAPMLPHGHQDMGDAMANARAGISSADPGAGAEGPQEGLAVFEPYQDLQAESLTPLGDSAPAVSASPVPMSIKAGPPLDLVPAAVAACMAGAEPNTDAHEPASPSVAPSASAMLASPAAPPVAALNPSSMGSRVSPLAMDPPPSTFPAGTAVPAGDLPAQHLEAPKPEFACKGTPAMEGEAAAPVHVSVPQAEAPGSEKEGFSPLFRGLLQRLEPSAGGPGAGWPRGSVTAPDPDGDAGAQPATDVPSPQPQGPMPGPSAAQRDPGRSRALSPEAERPRKATGMDRLAQAGGAIRDAGRTTTLNLLNSLKHASHTGGSEAGTRPGSAPREQLAAAGESMKRFGGEAARWGTTVLGNLQDATHRALGTSGNADGSPRALRRRSSLDSLAEPSPDPAAARRGKSPLQPPTPVAAPSHAGTAATPLAGVVSASAAAPAWDTAVTAVDQLGSNTSFNRPGSTQSGSPPGGDAQGVGFEGNYPLAPDRDALHAKRE